MSQLFPFARTSSAPRGSIRQVKHWGDQAADLPPRCNRHEAHNLPGLAGSLKVTLLRVCHIHRASSFPSSDLPICFPVSYLNCAPAFADLPSAPDFLTGRHPPPTSIIHQYTCAKSSCRRVSKRVQLDTLPLPTFEQSRTLGSVVPAAASLYIPASVSPTPQLVATHAVCRLD